MRYFLLIVGLVAIMTVVLFGKRGSTSRKPPIEVFPDMVRQPKVRPQSWSDFFPDHLGSRLPVSGTIPRSEPIVLAGKAVFPFEESPVNTGRIPGTTNFVETNPFPITQQLMARGQERFLIYCSPCHGAAGDGKGITAKLGMAVVGDLHDTKVRKVPQQPDGEIFNTITYGKNLMGAYGGIVPVSDRWAIIAYVRALERSRLATVEDVPANERSQLPNPPPPKSQPKATNPGNALVPAPATMPVKQP
jgi:mono/diheme cytochrome c family protein